MSYSLNKLISSIDKQTQNIVFSQSLTQLKQHKMICCFNLIEKIEEICSTRAFNSFIKNCYRLVLCKLLQNILFNKQQKYHTQYSFYSNNFLSEFRNLINISSSVIKQEYCQLLEVINFKKCQVMQLILFLIFFLTRDILLKLCQNCQTLRHYFMKKVSQSNDQLSILSCVLINYQITGFQVKKHVYIGLKNKYLFKKKHLKKKMENERYFSKLMSMKINDKENYIQKSKKIKKQQSKQLNDDKKLLKQVKTIFEDQNNLLIKNDLQVIKNQHSLNNLKEKSLTTLFGFKQVEDFGYSTLRNSCAFNQKRSNYEFHHPKRPIGWFYSNSKVNKKQNPSNLKLKEQQVQRKRKMGMSLVTASLRFLFTKNDKKNIARQVQKPSLDQWRKKINKMQHQTNIQRAKLDEIQSKWKKTTRNTQQDKDNKVLQFQKFFQQLKKQQKLKQQDERNRQFRQAFKEQITQRQHKQIGIVRSVVNFIPTNYESKHRKVRSREFKDQFRDFMKNMEQNYQNVLNQNNYNYRLQKVLLGNYRQ